jgi:hypothetical protein
MFIRRVRASRANVIDIPNFLKNVACETVHWRAGTFWAAYNNNIAGVLENVVKGDPVANAVRSLISARTQWTGTASDLLGALEIEAGERVVRAKTWPSTPQGPVGQIATSGAR